MFNMLIAIMGDTFDKITENKEVNAIKSKLKFMGNLVAIMQSEDIVENKEVFFFLVRPEEGDGDEGASDWEGTVKSLTRVMNNNNMQLKGFVNSKTQKLFNEFAEIAKIEHKQTNAIREHVDHVIKINVQKITTEIEQMKDQNLAIQKSQTEIKDQNLAF